MWLWVTQFADIVQTWLTIWIENLMKGVTFKVIIRVRFWGLGRVEGSRKSHVPTRLSYFGDLAALCCPFIDFCLKYRGRVFYSFLR
jgi:hypothetical protein